ncbi:MAG: hypothetical protein AAFQ83_09030 [Bacteroidota bacterium]
MNPFDPIDFPVDVPFATAEYMGPNITFFVAIRTSGQKKVAISDTITPLSPGVEAYKLIVTRLNEPTDKDEPKCYEESLLAPSGEAFYVEVEYVDENGNLIFPPQTGKKCKLFFERRGGGGGE